MMNFCHDDFIEIFRTQMISKKQLNLKKVLHTKIVILELQEKMIHTCSSRRSKRY